MRKALRKLKIRTTTTNIKKEDIIKDLEAIGLNRGDIVLLHSSLKSIGYVIGGPKTVINALIEVLGEEGTLVIPTYPRRGSMYETCMIKDYIFDVKKSPTKLGAIPTSFLKFKRISRSIHPTHSVSAIGKYSKVITETHHIGNKTYGENSPWGKILDLNGKVLGIGVSLHPNAQYHYVEDIMGDYFPLKVKVDEIFKLKCKIDENEYVYVNVNPLDPEIAKTRIDKKDSSFIRQYFWEIYSKLGILKVGKVGEATSWWVNAKKFCDILYNLAMLKITIYSTEEDLKRNKLYPFKLIKEKLNKLSHN